MLDDLERVVSPGDRFVSIHRVRLKARYTAIVQPARCAWTHRDGRLLHAQGFRGTHEVLEAAGLEK